MTECWVLSLLLAFFWVKGEAMIVQRNGTKNEIGHTMSCEKNGVDGVIGGGQFRCPVPNVVYQDVTDCEHFYVCINSNPYRLRCLPGYAFDVTKGYCCPKNEVTTCAVDNILQGYKCPSDGFQPNRLDCTKFYWCYNKSATELSCPSGMHFDKNSKLCLTPDQATCSSIINP